METQDLTRCYTPSRRLVHSERLNVPDAIGILVDAAVRGEEAHARDAGDALGDPLLLVFVRLIHKRVSLNVAVKVVRDKVVIAMVTNSRDHARKVLGVAKGAVLNGLKHLDQVGIDAVRAIGVRMAKILDILGEVTKEEYVILTNLTRDFNLWRVSNMLGPRNQDVLTLAPSQVPIMRPPLRTNFMLLVPEALILVSLMNCHLIGAEVTYSVPAVEMCSLISEAGMMSSALLTL